jgi:RNA polymerase sigma-70 factor (ECF subfamily)
MFLISNKKKTSPDYSGLPDTELTGLYRDTRDIEITGILFSRYAHLVYGVALKYIGDEDSAKDAVMEIFEKLPEDLLKHEIQNFKSWLYTVTKNHCLMKMRHQKVEERAKEVLKVDIERDFMENGREGHPVTKELNNKDKQLKEAIAALKDEQRRCIELVYLQEKSYQEVMEMTGYSYKQVKSYVQNAKRNLKIKLEDTIGREE